MRKSLFLGPFICLLALNLAAQKKPAAFYTVGFYQGIHLSSKESGDYVGVDVYLTQDDTHTYALVTIAEGGFMDPVLVDAKMSGKDDRDIEFTLPGDDGGRKFTGTVTASGLTLNYGGTKSVLKRSCGKTFTDVSTGGGGDVGGMEIYIMDSGGNWFALVSTAEGVLSKPVLVSAKVTGKDFDRVEFTLPGDNGSRKFTGVMGTSSLTLNSGGTRTVLKSKCYK